MSRKDALSRIAAQIARIEREEVEARDLASDLDRQLNAAREEYSGRLAGFGRLKHRLAEAEQTHSRHKLGRDAAVKAAAEAKTCEESVRNRLQTIGELAVQRAYSSESVQQFFNAVRGQDWAPLGILADFV
ncbi:MAG: hypothetical protein HYU27_10160, partial [Acidobacteria bacterium]|nr:hypothetical protein [Acidobacteriota bacterium]